MHGMQSADAKLLVALDALLHESSVTAAARRMHVTPPAMSHTLARLRETLGDPLFVRAGNRLVPTPRAVELRDRGGTRGWRGDIAAHAQETVRRRYPQARVRDSRVGRNRGDARCPLNARVRAEAPGVALHCVAAASDDVDLDIGVQHGRAPDRRVQRLGAPDLLVRATHPMKRATPAQLAALEEIGVLTKAQSRWPKKARTSTTSPRTCGCETPSAPCASSPCGAHRRGSERTPFVRGSRHCRRRAEAVAQRLDEEPDLRRGER
jgi:DNA-binding transcriptional LysR family regulator